MTTTEVHDELVLFHKIPKAKVVLSQAGTLSEHDVYALLTGEDLSQWGLYAKKGSGYIRLFATKMTGKTGVKVHSFHLPFAVTSSPLGYLSIPSGYRWP